MLVFFWELTQFTVPSIIFSLMPWNNSHLCGPLLILCFRNIHIFFSHHKDSSRRALVRSWTLSYSYTFSPANLCHYRVPELFRGYSFSYWHPLYPSHLSDFHAMWKVVNSDFTDEMMRHEPLPLRDMSHPLLISTPAWSHLQFSWWQFAEYRKK